MQHCDQTCTWCARHFWKWVAYRMKSGDRNNGRSGGGKQNDAAATSIRAKEE